MSDALEFIKQAKRCIQETMTGKTSKLNAALEHIKSAEQALQEYEAIKPELDKMIEAKDEICKKEPHGCWSVRCNLGKVCKKRMEYQVAVSNAITKIKEVMK